MELLAYVLAFFGFFILIKGIKPTIVWINNITDKDLAKGVVIIAIFLTVCFYPFAVINYLLSLWYFEKSASFIPIVFLIDVIVVIFF